MFKVEIKKGIKVRHKLNGGFNAILMCLLLALDPPVKPWDDMFKKKTSVHTYC